MKTKHCYETQKKNGSLRSSKQEDKCYEKLKEIFSDIKRNYKEDIRYPFACDFYIPKFDLFIECNFHWTHGGHPFNPNNNKDVERLNKMSERNTKFYRNAIHTWTVRDVNKREIAKENNLNYIEFWNDKELDEFILNFRNK